MKANRASRELFNSCERLYHQEVNTGNVGLRNTGVVRLPLNSFALSLSALATPPGGDLLFVLGLESKNLVEFPVSLGATARLQNPLFLASRLATEHASTFGSSDLDGEGLLGDHSTYWLRDLVQNQLLEDRPDGSSTTRSELAASGLDTEALLAVMDSII